MTDDAAPTEPKWLPLSVWSPATLVAGIGVPGGVFVVILLFQIVNLGIRSASVWNAVALVVIVLVPVALVCWVIARRFLPAAVDLRAERLRVRGRVTPLADIDNARLVATMGSDSARSTFAHPINDRRVVLSLELRTGSRPITAIVLRGRDDQPIAPPHSELLVAALQRTSIRIPQRSEDPTGRFAWFNDPGHVDRDGAIAAVQRPPGHDEKISVASAL